MSLPVESWWLSYLLVLQRLHPVHACWCSSKAHMMCRQRQASLSDHASALCDVLPWTSSTPVERELGTKSHRMRSCLETSSHPPTTGAFIPKKTRNSNNNNINNNTSKEDHYHHHHHHGGEGGGGAVFLINRDYFEALLFLLLHHDRHFSCCASRITDGI